MRQQRWSFVVWVCTLAIAFMCAESRADDGWQIDWAPAYLWAVGLSGTQTAPALLPPGAPPDTPLPVDIGFNDVVEMLDLGVTTHLEARKGVWGFLFDFGYLGLTGETQVPLPPGLPGPVTTEIDLVNSFTEIAVMRRLGTRERSFELLAGARYTFLKIEVHPPTVDLPPGLPLPVFPDLEEEWIDPIVGGLYTNRFAPRWMLQLRGDVGGFGVGSGSHLTWHAYALVGYQLKRKLALMGGYRVLDYDYRDGREITSYDVREDGVFFGVALRLGRSTD